jgi:hypothetical protein
MITSIQLSFFFLWLHSLPLRRGSNFLFIDQLDAKPFCRGIGSFTVFFFCPAQAAGGSYFFATGQKSKQKTPPLCRLRLK